MTRWHAQHSGNNAVVSDVAAKASTSQTPAKPEAPPSEVVFGKYVIG